VLPQHRRRPVANEQNCDAHDLCSDVRVPSLKVAITFAFVGSIVAETVAGNKGIGNLMLVASSRFEVPLAFAGLLATSILGIGMYLVAEFLERRTTGWATRRADGVSELRA
jgi:ABC-type proline/glycine betaine transport system permease subunit